MSRPWYRLNIDISNAVRADFDFDKLYTDSEFANKPAGLWQFNSKTLTNLFNDSWIDYLKSTGFPITGAMLFYRAPYFIHPQAHIDVRATGIKSIYGVNWVINDNDDSEMIWYDTPAIGGINEKSEAGTLYTY